MNDATDDRLQVIGPPPPPSVGVPDLQGPVAARRTGLAGRHARRLAPAPRHIRDGAAPGFEAAMLAEDLTPPGQVLPRRESGHRSLLAVPAPLLAVLLGTSVVVAGAAGMIAIVL